MTGVRRPLVAALLAAGILASTGCGVLGLPDPRDRSPEETSNAAPMDTADTQEPPPPVALVIDASGTMVKGDVAPSRMTAAKAAARAVVTDTPAQARLGLLTYGTGTGNSDSDRAAGCQDVTSLVPVAAVGDEQRRGLIAAVDGLAPSGYTPIGLALRRGAEALDGTGTVVLISDGEDTCAPPDPCQVARDLRAAHPDLTISTVGFRTDPTAREQLTCIASAGGGVFVTADDPGQLTRRLGMATDTRVAQAALTTTGVGGAEIGMSHADLVAVDPRFPALDTADRYSGSVPGRDLVVIVYQDCDYIFENGTLVALQPQRTVTVDRVQVDDPVAAAIAVYGQPLSDTQNSDGTHTVFFPADPATGTHYQMVLSGPIDDPGTRIRVIVLCRCAPGSEVGSEMVLTQDAVGDISTERPYREVKRELITRFGEPDSIHDIECEAAGFHVGEQLGWGDFYFAGWGEQPGRLEVAGWTVTGPNTPVPMSAPRGFHLGEHKRDVMAATGAVDASADEEFIPALVIASGRDWMSWGYDWDTGRITSVSTLGWCE